MEVSSETSDTPKLMLTSGKYRKDSLQTYVNILGSMQWLLLIISERKGIT